MTRRVMCLTLIAIITVSSLGLRGQVVARAIPLEPIDAIIDAFRTHQVVALGEGAHGNVPGHLFRLALLRDARFAATVNDIVVEFGSARYQEVMDRFTRGDDVPLEELRHAWEDTTGPNPAWDKPIYEEFFRAVRDINRTLLEARRIRVLLGDPPIDWDGVRSATDYSAWAIQRDRYPADLTQRQVIAKGRRALLIYGDGHYQAHDQRPPRSLGGLLEAGGATPFFITTAFQDLTHVQPDIATWRAPRLALLSGTAIGALPYEFFFGPKPPLIRQRGGGPRYARHGSRDARFHKCRRNGVALVKPGVSRSMCRPKGRRPTAGQALWSLWALREIASVFSPSSLSRLSFLAPSLSFLPRSSFQ